jgi:hypothetical protein
MPFPPNPMFTRPITARLNSSLRSGVAASAPTPDRADIIPQPMS